MKNMVKDAVGHFKVLMEHSSREYDPHPIHFLKRMVLPICGDFEKIIQDGTKNDAWQTLESIVRECHKLSSES